jgi:hypothetical protein
MKKQLLWFLFWIICLQASSQNVGIGTNSPVFRLDVQGRMRVKSGTLGNVNTSSGIWMDDYRDGTNRFFFGMKDSIRAGFYGGGNGGTGWDFTFNTLNGNVGIGILEPVHKLAVDGNIGIYSGGTTRGLISSSGSNLLFNASLGSFVNSIPPGNLILQSGSFSFPAGNVGIGTNSPDEKLDVSGNIKLSGELNKPSTGQANLVPIAYGKVTSAGFIVSGTGNFTVSYGLTGGLPPYSRYLITIPSLTTAYDAVIILTPTKLTHLPGFVPISGTAEPMSNSSFAVRFMWSDPIVSTLGEAKIDFSFVVYAQ